MKISFIIPTINERNNIYPTFIGISKILVNYKYEIIFVDDGSDDGTIDKISELMKFNDNVKLYKRNSNKGLSSAIGYGFDNSSGNVLAVIDADLSYDFEAIPAMIKSINSGSDIVLGSRYLIKHSTSQFSVNRKFISSVATFLSRINLKKPLTDPLTGYGMLKKEIYNDNKNLMKFVGFKFLYELIVVSKTNKISEVHTFFKDRIVGKSKFSLIEIYNFIFLVIFLKISK